MAADSGPIKLPSVKSDLRSRCGTLMEAPDEALAEEIHMKVPRINPVLAAKRRLRMQLREEVRAARKARKKERLRAKRRPGANVDLEEFLVRTKQRLEERFTQAEAHAVKTAAKVVELQTFELRAQERVASHARAAKAAAEAQKAANVARAAALAASADLEQFRRKTQRRMMQSLWSKLPQVQAAQALDADFKVPCTAGFARRRIGIVGAGPTGLWAAVLLAQKYSQLDHSSGVRRPDAPEILILEGRAEEAHCSRRDILIGLSSSTQKLLNRRTRSAAFCSGMAVAEIEKELLRRWQLLCPPGCRIEFAHPINSPGQFVEAEGLDVVLWTAGRRSLDDHFRKALGCEMRVGGSEQVLVFELTELLCKSVTSDLSTIAQNTSGYHSLRIILRPGLGGACAAWLWLFGLPQEVSAAAARAGAVPYPTLSEALDAAFIPDPPTCTARIRLAVEALNERLQPTSCTARWVHAAFWSSDCSVCDLASLGTGSISCPFLVLGDAACGKPFYMSTTLNKHLWDIAALVDDVEWTPDGKPMTCARFQQHEKRYQAELHRVAEFHRSPLEVS